MQVFMSIFYLWARGENIKKNDKKKKEEGGREKSVSIKKNQKKRKF